MIYKVPLEGFPPSRIQLDQKGDEIILHGNEADTSMKHSVRKFEQHVRVPDDILKETIHCGGINNGQLILSAKRRDSQ
jgi:hypothetical protein